MLTTKSFVPVWANFQGEQSEKSAIFHLKMQAKATSGGKLKLKASNQGFSGSQIKQNRHIDGKFAKAVKFMENYK